MQTYALVIQNRPLTLAKGRGPVVRGRTGGGCRCRHRPRALRLPRLPGTLAPPGRSSVGSKGGVGAAQLGKGLHGPEGQPRSRRPVGKTLIVFMSWVRLSICRGGSPWRAVPCPGHCGDSPQAPSSLRGASSQPVASAQRPRPCTRHKHRPARALLLPLESGLPAVPAFGDSQMEGARRACFPGREGRARAALFRQKPKRRDAWRQQARSHFRKRSAPAAPQTCPTSRLSGPQVSA